MPEFDENVWSHMHQAAYRGFIKSIHRFVEEDSSILESESNDEYKATPFLLAVESGTLETVECLLGLGSKIDAINSRNHGAVEICALRGYTSLLIYFVNKNDEKLPVWKRLLQFLASDMETDVIAAGKSLTQLTDASTKDYQNYRGELIAKGAIPTTISFAGSSLPDQAKADGIKFLLNLLESEDVQEIFVNASGAQAYIKLLKSTNETIIKLAAMVLEKLTLNKNHADCVVRYTALPALYKVIQNIKTPNVLVPVLNVFSNVAIANTSHQKTIGTLPNFFENFVLIGKDNADEDMMKAYTMAVDNIVRDEKNNQNAFIAAEGTEILMETLVRHSRNKEVQLSTVEAIHSLGENNPSAQETISNKGIQKLLMQMLRKSRADEIQEKTGMALWALAGNDIEKQRKMAEGIGVSSLIEFLNSKRENLHYISSEGLGVLAQGPISLHQEIANANGIQPLIRLLESDKDYYNIILSVIRTLRYLSVGVGNVPFTDNQSSIDKCGGVDILIQLLLDGQDDLIKVEAAVTLAHVALGRENITSKINSHPDFSFIRILKMMYAKEDMVRLLAGSALATFAYNNVNQQKEISLQGGVRFNCFVPFLKSSDEFYRCNAAYQVVILALIIPDEEQATSSAVGIKLLVELLHDSKSNQILALAADCIARLAHTRAGVPAAIVAINGIDFLFELLNSGTVPVEGCASIALSYLSYNHTGERRLLYKCRTDPFLKKILNKYTRDKHRLSEDFIEGWKHFKRVGIPPIPEDRIKKFEPADEIQLQLTTESPRGTTTGVESSTSHVEDVPLTERSARSSLTPQRSTTNTSFQETQTSVPATRTHSSVSFNLSQQELVLQEG